MAVKATGRNISYCILDGIVFKVRKDSRVVNKCLYSVLGINLEGRKEILGIWLSENESASFWVTVCNELKTEV